MSRSRRTSARHFAAALRACLPCKPNRLLQRCLVTAGRAACVRARDSAAQYSEGLQLHVHHGLPTLEHRELLRVGLP